MPDKSTRPEVAYLALLIIGIALPVSQFVPWLVEHGLDLPLLIKEVFATPISSFFGWDVIVSVTTLLVLAVLDRELPVRQRTAVAAGSLLGASVGLPLYLLLRERNARKTAVTPRQ